MAFKKTKPIPNVADVDFNAPPFQDEFKKIYEDLHSSGCPFAHSEPGDYYAVASHADIKSILKDYRQWKSKFGAALSYTPAGEDVLISTDPPQHTQQVRIIAGSFSAEYFESLRPDLESYVHEVIDRHIRDGSMDLHKELSIGLPLFAVSKILGIPLIDEQGHDRTPWLRDMVLTGFSTLFLSDQQLSELLNTGFTMPMEQENAMRVVALFTNHIEVCREGLETGKYREDSNLVTRLLCARDVENNPLPDHKILGFMQFVLTAGSGTTTVMLTNIFYRLLTENGVYQRLRAEPKLYQQMIEETLRIDAPVHGLFRTNEDPIKFGPLELTEETKVLLLFGAAGLDPEVFADPMKFNLDRNLNEIKRHMAFGYGTHFCRGAPLARMEAQIALSVVLERLPNLRLVKEPQPDQRMPVMMGFKDLLVAWD